VERHGVDHVDELGLVGGGHHDEIGKRAQISEVEAAGVRLSVGADQPGAVHREAHRQVLDRDVVDDLVVGALQEGRIDRAERPIALRGEPGGEGHPMLLGDADVERALREFGRDLVEAGARRHRCGDRDHLLVALHLGDQRFGEHIRIAGRPAAGLGLLARRRRRTSRPRDICRRLPRPGRSPCPCG
jgi:hypothetical protein